MLLPWAPWQVPQVLTAIRSAVERTSGVSSADCASAAVIADVITAVMRRRIFIALPSLLRSNFPYQPWEPVPPGPLPSIGKPRGDINRVVVVRIAAVAVIVRAAAIEL